MQIEIFRRSFLLLGFANEGLLRTRSAESTCCTSSTRVSECPRPDTAACYHRRDRSIGHGRERAGGQTPTDGREDAPDDARSGRASDGEAFLSRPADVPQRARIADSSNASAYFVSVLEGQGPGRDLPLSIRVGEAITDVELRREDRIGDSRSLWCRHQFIRAGPRFAGSLSSRASRRSSSLMDPCRPRSSHPEHQRLPASRRSDPSESRTTQRMQSKSAIALKRELRVSTDYVQHVQRRRRPLCTRAVGDLRERSPAGASFSRTALLRG